MYAWWQRYQVVSYKIFSRSGTKEQLKDMVERCDRAGVKIYIDFIPNHMTGPTDGTGQLMNILIALLIHRPPGIAGSTFDGHRGNYPAVPYSPEHFNMNI